MIRDRKVISISYFETKINDRIFYFPKRGNYGKSHALLLQIK